MNRKSFLKFLILVVGLVIFILVMAKPAEATSPGWVIRTLDSLGDTGTWTTLEIDPRGVVHISYGSGEQGTDPRYAYFQNGRWRRLKVPGCSGAAGIAMDVDGFGVAHFTCHKLNVISASISEPRFAYDLIYANSGGGYEVAFHYQDSCANKGLLYGTAIAMNSQGLPEIMHGFGRNAFGPNKGYCSGADNDGPQPYFQGSFDTIKVPTGVWVSEKTGEGEVYWDQHFDAFDGNHMVSYLLSVKPGEAQLIYTCPEGCETVQKGYDAALDLDNKGYPHLSFGSGGFLWYATKPNDKEWRIEKVDIVSSVGRFSDIAVDAWGNPHISYYDETLGDLKYATRDEDGWRIQTVDAIGDVGKWSSIDVSPFGKPSISYYKALSGDLKYAYQP